MNPSSNIRLSHPAPVEELPAEDFQLTVNGQPVFVHQARVSACPLNQFWPGYQRPLEQTEIASFASWTMDAPVELSLVSSREIKDVRVRPRSSGIVPQVQGRTITFAVDKPGQFTVEVNGTHHALHLFANPPEQNIPDPGDPQVRYFGPGVHCPGLIVLDSNQTVYIADGAVVYGAIFAVKANNITICGRGILDGSKCDRFDIFGLISFHACSDIRIEGVTLRDSSLWTVVPMACRNIHIHNVKLIGHWRYNSDGIDFVNCQDAVVENSFIRSFDDSVVLKGYKIWEPFIYRFQIVDDKWPFSVDGVKPSASFYKLQQLRFGLFPSNAAAITNIQVRRCVIWNEWGRALEIGAETAADEISGILFEDCDIIHTTHVAMDIQNCDRALCRNIIFRNIRVECDDDLSLPIMQSAKDQKYQVAPSEPYQPHLIVLENVKSSVSFDLDQRGRIEDIQFKDITVTAHDMPPSRLSGFDADHLVQRISIENLRVNGQPVATLKDGCFTTNEYVRDITFQTK